MILDINECDTDNPCITLASCSNTEGSFLCSCNAGYTGDGYTCQGTFNDTTMLERHTSYVDDVDALIYMRSYMDILSAVW